ncbi:hypothetical protein [Slackia isoflavoniconvertens]|uniref:hypothetical protein n=1 Tax=Slackia isoflavoniconvertens TaxID=572010 RepID=UPI003A92901E
MAWGDKKNDKRANESPFNAGDPTMPWDISSSTKAYKNRAQDPFGEPAEGGVSAPVVASKAASEQVDRSAHSVQSGDSSRFGQPGWPNQPSPQDSPFSTPAGNAAPSSVPAPPPPPNFEGVGKRAAQSKAASRPKGKSPAVVVGIIVAAFVVFTVILGAIVAFDSFLDEQAPTYGDVDDTEVIGSDHEVYAPETDDEKAIFDVATTRLGSVASGDDEILHAAIANDFADCILGYTGESAASLGLDADAYADWAMRSLVYEVDWVYVDDEADEATVYYYANSYRSYDVAREVCYAIADGVDAQEALSNACENAKMGYELFLTVDLEKVGGTWHIDESEWADPSENDLLWLFA